MIAPMDPNSSLYKRKMTPGTYPSGQADAGRGIPSQTYSSSSNWPGANQPSGQMGRP